MIENIEDIDSIAWVLIAAIAGAVYALFFGWGRRRITPENTEINSWKDIKWESVGRVALEGAGAGMLVVLSGDALNIENLEMAAPIVAPWADKIVLTLMEMAKLRNTN